MVVPNFVDNVRAVVWAIVLLALVAFALAALVLDWHWIKIAVPAVLAVLMSLLAPGRRIGK